MNNKNWFNKLLFTTMITSMVVLFGNISLSNNKADSITKSAILICMGSFNIWSLKIIWELK